MPVVTAFLDPRDAPLGEIADRFTAAVAASCRDVLRAAPDKVQIQIMQAIAPQHGAAIYLEVNYRDQDFRDADTMARFMEGLETICLELFSLTPRIRCFPHQHDQLFARN